MLQRVNTSKLEITENFLENEALQIVLNNIVRDPYSKAILKNLTEFQKKMYY